MIISISYSFWSYKISIFDWERDIEFIDYEKERQALEFEHAYKELPFALFAATDNVVRYQTTKNRIVTMRIRNEDVETPRVTAYVKAQGGKEKIRMGELLGSHDIAGRVFTPQLLIANQLPIIRGLGSGHEESALPLPLFGFDLQLVPPTE